MDVIRHRFRKASLRVINPFIPPTMHCYACGNDGFFKVQRPIKDSLADAWGLSRHERLGFDIRESTHCTNCKSSYRSNLHARTICEQLAPGARSLVEASKLPAFRKLSIAEINACGNLHRFLEPLPNLLYSEYKPSDKSIRSEDLHNLSYGNDALDSVLTSDTLEHVPNWQLAIREIHRVLKPGGVHIFTIPILLSRQTVTRAKLTKSGRIKHLSPPSHHGKDKDDRDDYIVFSEFGSDALNDIDQFGFETTIHHANRFDLHDPNLVLVSRKIDIGGKRE